MRKLTGLTEFIRLITAPSGPTGIEAIPSIEDMRHLARRRVPKMIFDFVDGGSGDENTLGANVADLREVTLQPRTLVDVSARDATTSLSSGELPLPLVLGPAGLVRVVGREGELAAVRAAGERGVPYTISTSSAWSIEEIAEAAKGPLWFQLYLWRSRDLIERLVQRAKEAGCTALVLTVDVPLNANRIRDLRNGMSIPPRLTLQNSFEATRHPRWLADMLQGPPIGFRNFAGIAEGDSALSHSEFINRELSNLQANWEDLRWLRSTWQGPLYIKGITTVRDARLALAAGVDGIVVSNHGGRQLDGLPSSISSFTRIAEAVGGRAELMLDGGIRTGVDIAKALALGADAVMVARPWVFGVAAGGSRGVRRVIEIFEQEYQQTLALLGAGRTSDLSRDLVRYPAQWRNEPHLDTETPTTG